MKLCLRSDATLPNLNCLVRVILPYVFVAASKFEAVSKVVWKSSYSTLRLSNPGKIRGLVSQTEVNFIGNQASFIV